MCEDIAVYAYIMAILQFIFTHHVLQESLILVSKIYHISHRILKYAKEITDYILATKYLRTRKPVQ